MVSDARSSARLRPKYGNASVKKTVLKQALKYARRFEDQNAQPSAQFSFNEINPEPFEDTGTEHGKEQRLGD